MNLEEAIAWMNGYMSDAQVMNLWPQVRDALLTMQRERDEARDELNRQREVNRTTGEHLLDANLRLAASERTCAELRASIENAVVGMNTLSAQSVQLVDENARLIARAEAAERTVEGLRAELTKRSA